MGTRKKTKKPAVRSSKQLFETTFLDRLGQTPSDFIAAKIAAGSDVKSTEYLFDITAAAIAGKCNCKPRAFDEYYRPMPEEVKIVPKTITYNKLVRDRIPEIIEASGKSCAVETLDNDRYIKMLDAKLQEELNEYQESKSLEELADLLEVMGAVVKARGYTWEQLTEIRKEKKEKRGGFEKRLLLKEVRE